VLKRSAPESRGTYRGLSFRKIFATCALIAAIALAWPSASDAFADNQKNDFTKWQRGRTTDFSLRDVDEQSLRLSSLRGRVVFLHFFATWCEPCREELPALNRLLERDQSRQIAIVAISVAEVPDRVRRFFEKQNLALKFPVLLDQDRAVTKAWGVQILPSTIVLDRKLSPRLVVASDYAWDQLDIGQLLTRLSSTRTTATNSNRKIVIRDIKPRGDPDVY